jgi:recombination DNA repair RAD52 pathway protein
MTLTPEQKAELGKPLNSANVKTREQGRSTLSYVEAWHVIAEANRIFDFDAWDRETISNVCVSERERKVGKGQYEKDGWGVTYIAKVRITVGGVVREGTGAGHGIDVDLGLAHESAAKESESDAMKRALMTFGNPFGLALYDKTQANVTDDTPPKPSARPVETQETKAPYKPTPFNLHFTAITQSKTVDDLTEAWRAVRADTSLSKEEGLDLTTAKEAQRAKIATPNFDGMQQ